MHAQMFLSNFDAIADSRGSTDVIRRLIRRLALEGRLLPVQGEPLPDPTKLLAMARADLADLKAAGKVGRHTLGELPPDGFENRSLPHGWRAMRLSQICARRSGNSKLIKGKLHASPGPSLFPGFSAAGQDVWLDGFDYEGVAVVVSAVGARCGKSFLAEGRWSAIANTAIVWGFPGLVLPRFLLFLLNNEDFWVRSGGAQPFVSFGPSLDQVVYVPPISDQQAIVDKIDELMALCDELETRQQSKAFSAAQFRRSAVDALVNADNDPAQAWIRVQDNWEILTDRPDSVDDIRNAILELAVRGKLLTQESTDEPARLLLDRCSQERDRLAHSRKLRLPKSPTPIDQIAKPFQIPVGWSWCRFTDVGTLERGRSKHRPRNDPALYVGGNVPLIQTGDVARASGTITSHTALYNEAGVAQSRLWPEGTLCITIAANIADSALLGFGACFPDSVVGFVPFSCIGGAKWFEYFMRTAKSHLDMFAPSTAQKNINLAILDEVLIPLPPLAEQRRIVARVDELLRFCDELESRLQERDRIAENLAASVTHHLLL